MMAVLSLFSCAPTVYEGPTRMEDLTDYTQIPDVTEEEIAAIEIMRMSGRSFKIAMMPPNTELFYAENGELSGYMVLLSKWLSDLFGITFTTEFYDWPEMLAGLADHSIDFTGELTATAERRDYLYMTDTIGERTIKAIRRADGRRVVESTADNPVRCCFLAGTTSYDAVAPYVSNIEVIFADSLAEVLVLFAEDKIDAFIVDGTAEAVFDTDPSFVADDFAPIIYSPVSLSTQNPALAPIISVVQKLLASEYRHCFTDLYKTGYTQYLRRKLLIQLTPEEKAYIDNHIERGLTVPYIGEYDNYPLSFYHEREEEWQGASEDILAEISKITGLTFERMNAPGTVWADMYPMLKSGEVAMASELIQSPEREGRYLWADEPYLTDNFALISTAEREDLRVSDISYLTVGLLEGSAYEEFFNERFSDHKKTIVYDNIFSAVDAMERGEIELLMATRNMLLTITNYMEKPGFRTNLVFMRASDSAFGFHLDQKILCSIVSKAQRLIDTHTITEHWRRMVFDYKSAIAREQRPLWMGLGVMVLLIMVLLAGFGIRNSRASALLEETVRERTKALEMETKTNRDILNFNPFNSLLFDEEGNILDCNLSAQEFFGLYGPNLREQLAASLEKMVPTHQLDGRESLPLTARLSKAFETGQNEFETMFIVDGREVCFDVTMKRVLYQGKSAVIIYMFDLTAQKAVQSELSYHGAMLDALGKVSNLLLAADAKDLDRTMHTALEFIGCTAAVDRVYIWKNHVGDDERLFATQIFEWSPEAEPQQGTEFAVDVPFDDVFPTWRTTLAEGKSYNRIVREALSVERAHLEPQGAVSILLVPIFLQNEFWGFIGFDDCRNERVFTDTEENILRICGFMAMVISDTIQNEVAIQLLAEREAALISAQIKTNFLANMSHEIRTPMNAIQGMIELIMRENINNTVLAHATDIRNACRSLLSIINDILDISKIESGKLEIVPTRYHVSSLLMDVISIIDMRADKKQIAFVVDIDPNIPCELVGDEVRIKQVLINLLNNAVKFTQVGSITLSVSGEITDNTCRLTFSVADTGVGVKREDYEKLFVLFQQVDTKRNRNVEGTGLGLPISKELVEMMGGTISLESVYGSGSTFTVVIDQPMANRKPVAALRNPGRTSALIYESRAVYLNSLTQALSSLGCDFKACSNRSEMHTLLDEGNYSHVFVSSLSVGYIQDVVAEKQPKAVIAVLNDDGSPYYSNNVVSVTMPIHCLQLAGILNDDYNDYDGPPGTMQTAGIIAPNARVLLVDDNAVNLKVAAGLLKTYRVQTDTASGGAQAVEMVREKEYDLVFMDHMMPEVDGIDATVAIRALGGKNERLPIIALTANALGGMREMFKAEGLDDFLPKPIEVTKLDIILRKWLPKELQQSRPSSKSAEKSHFGIAGVDMRSGISNSGGVEEEYNEILAIFASDSENRLAEIAKYHAEGNLRALTICVHAVKSASANIGAEYMAEMAAELEAAGKAGDTVHIDANLPRFTELTLLLLQNIRTYLKELRDGAEIF